MLRSVALDDLCILAVTGSERVAFLQGQLTQDVALARQDKTVMAGWADAKGRLLFAGHLFVTSIGGEEALALLVPAERAEMLLKRLRMYILRTKVQATLPDISVHGMFGDVTAIDAAQCLGLQGHETRHLVLSSRETVLASAIKSPRTDWQLADIRSGLPVITAATTGEFVPQMVNLDLLGGISFTKGCYTGQEIVARMKYLGRVKRRMLRFAAAVAPEPGAQLYARRGAVGKVVLSAPAEPGSEFLAVVVLDDLPGPFFLDEAQTVPAHRLELPYEVPA